MAGSLSNDPGVYFKDQVDPSDPAYRIIEMRIPFSKAIDPNYGPYVYLGSRAVQRIRRLCALWLEGHGDVHRHLAAKIWKNACALEDKMPAHPDERLPP